MANGDSFATLFVIPSRHLLSKQLKLSLFFLFLWLPQKTWAVQALMLPRQNLYWGGQRCLFPCTLLFVYIFVYMNICVPCVRHDFQTFGATTVLFLFCFCHWFCGHFNQYNRSNRCLRMPRDAKKKKVYFSSVTYSLLDLRRRCLDSSIN